MDQLVRFKDLSVTDRTEVQRLNHDAYGFVLHHQHLVVHRGDQIAQAVYIGRPTQWGNPFALDEYGLLRPEYERRVLCLLDYTSNLLHGSQQELRDKLYLLRARPLACWCRRSGDFRPGRLCHGDVLSYIANRLGSF